MGWVAQLTSSLDCLNHPGCLEKINQSTQLKENHTTRVVDNSGCGVAAGLNA